MIEKRAARDRWQQRRPKDPQTLHRWNKALCAALLEAPLFRGARQVAIFFPRSFEPDLRPLWEARPRHCYFPRVDGVTLAMTYYRVSALTELIAGFGRIPEPPVDPSRAALPWTADDLILVPGAAFDRTGGRVGTGLGCYDRFLASIPAAKWGVAFSPQLVIETLAQETTDVRMDGLCTELGLEKWSK